MQVIEPSLLRLRKLDPVRMSARNELFRMIVPPELNQFDTTLCDVGCQNCFRTETPFHRGFDGQLIKRAVSAGAEDTHIVYPALFI